MGSVSTSCGYQRKKLHLSLKWCLPITHAPMSAAFSAASSAENYLAPPAALAAAVSPDDAAGVAASPLFCVDEGVSSPVALDRAGAVAGTALPSAGAALPVQHPAAAAKKNKSGTAPQKPCRRGWRGRREGRLHRRRWCPPSPLDPRGVHRPGQPRREGEGMC